MVLKFPSLKKVFKTLEEEIKFYDSHCDVMSVHL